MIRDASSGKPDCSLVWGDDDLAAELGSKVSVKATTAEWVVVAVEPGEAVRKLGNLGAIHLIACDTPSRGMQLNTGAKQARGSLLCFHHANSELRQEHLEALVSIARNDRIVGEAFHRRFDNRQFWMIRWEQLLRHTSPIAGPLFGDQSIFVKAETFHKRGFADTPIMEDIEFSRRLRRMGHIALLDPPLWSSPRRFRRLGSVSSSALNTLNPGRIHRWYYPSHLDRLKKRQPAADRFGGPVL
jgi:hypothetical protein